MSTPSLSSPILASSVTYGRDAVTSSSSTTITAAAAATTTTTNAAVAATPIPHMSTRQQRPHHHKQQHHQQQQQQQQQQQLHNHHQDAYSSSFGPASPSASYMTRIPILPHHARSVPVTPDGPVAISPTDPGSYTPLLLPRTPAMSSTATITTTVADAGNVGRQKGLMRRLSRSTGNRLRRGTSSNNMREQSSGSVVVRQSNGNPSSADTSFDISDFELDESEDAEAALTKTPQLARTPSLSRSSTASGRPIVRQPSTGSSSISSKPNQYQTSAIDPASRLDDIQGTPLLKYTRRKQKSMYFFLDPKAARLSWSTSRDKTRGKYLYLDHIRELRLGKTALNLLRQFGLPEDASDRWLTIIYIDSEASKGRASKSLHLLASDRKLRDAWVEWLSHVMYSRGDMMAKIAGISDEHRQKVWLDFVNDKTPGTPRDERERMSFAELKAVCRKWAINKSEKDLRQRFDDVNPSQLPSISRHQFLSLFRTLAERRDLKGLFQSIKSDQSSPFLQQQDFLNFLRHVQGIDVDADSQYWVSVFDLYQATTKSEGIDQAMPQRDPNSPLGMSWQTFQDFMVSDHVAWDAAPCRGNAKLDRPLNEYWISSSHNTYLKGRQVYGTSDAQEYVDALKKGCRCVEIDCWDGADGQPVVTHGRTLTTKRPFEECIDRVNRFAFVSSSYPVSISLEVHCSAPQQAAMAEIMKRHFGSKLLLLPLHPDASSRLPSPEDLKGKILVKVKKPARQNWPTASLPVPIPQATQHRRQRSQSEPNPRSRTGQTRKLSGPHATPSTSTSTSNTASYLAPRLPLASATFPIPEGSDGPDCHTAQTTPTTATTAVTSTATSVDGGNTTASTTDDSDLDPLEQHVSKKPKKQSNIIPVLGELGVYLRGVKISSFNAPEAREFNHIFSFNETTFEEHCRELDEARLLEEHNMRYMMRVYPRGSRIESSNFDPIRFWRRGVQMVATNWQTHDLGTQVNDAMFAVGSDRTGYVLKPEGLRPAADGTSPRPLAKKLVKFSVDVISARRLARSADMGDKSEMNPYVELEVLMADDPEEGQATGQGGSDASARHGKLGIGAPPKQRTNIVAGNGFDPIWNQPLHFTLETKLPELVFVKFSVFNSADPRFTSNSKEPLASFTAKLCTLPQGYRHFSLRRGNNDKLLSQLFCRIRKDEIRDIGVSDVSADVSAPDVPAARSSEDSARSSSKDILRGIFQRTPSHSRKGRREQAAAGFLSRTTSVERHN